jgi:hypothetical protein
MTADSTMVTPHVTEILPPWMRNRAAGRSTLGMRTATQRDLVLASLLDAAGRREVYPRRTPRSDASSAGSHPRPD